MLYLIGILLILLFVFLIGSGLIFFHITTGMMSGTKNFMQINIGLWKCFISKNHNWIDWHKYDLLGTKFQLCNSCTMCREVPIKTPEGKQKF